MNSGTLKFDPGQMLYSGIIGTGGIGSGKFFALNGEHTLGREESRCGHFLDINDYCKQHIILHYCKILLGPYIDVLPLGKIGDDEVGDSLFKEMSETGFNMHRIEKIPHTSTLFSFCFSYPDGSGGNLTTDNSASALVDAAFIEKAEIEIKNLGKKGIILAAPEVPFKARERLLEYGKQFSLFCAASFNTEEMRRISDSGIFETVDLLAINMDEAAAFVNMSTIKTNSAELAQLVFERLHKKNPQIMVSVTDGKQGSWCWDGNKIHRYPAAKAVAISTAGAGDAFFSGLLCGLALGCNLSDSQQFASLLAGLSVTSPHTINKEIDRAALKKFSLVSGLTFSENVLKLLEE